VKGETLTGKDNRQTFSYVVGEEKLLADIIAEEDVMPLVKGVVRAGATSAAVTDENDNVLWNSGDGVVADARNIILPLYLEGEVVGKLSVSGEREDEGYLKGLAELFMEALKIILANKLKRMLTTEIHSTVVNQSYEELLEINRKLSASETSYRNLAESLEIKVEERTEELKRALSRLLQQEKMASIGQLAAGVAHEINNPLGFIYSNLQTMDKYVTRFMAMLDYYRSAIPGAAGKSELIGSCRRKWEELKLDAVCADVFELIKQSVEGAQRVKKIVSDLKDFSHVDAAGEYPADLNAEIDKTLNVLTHEMPAGTEIVRNFGPLPGFACKPALICQVFLNLLLNAVQARRMDLRLVIATMHDGESIRLSFADNGPGIPDEIKNRIFEPFYTTKDVGAGAGMGLTVAYDIISAYGGTIEVNCPEDGGAVFTITLPDKRIG
jgi:two-component system NtrC family sensor kinase